MPTHETAQVRLHFGALSDPIAAQLHAQGLECACVAEFQTDADAVTGLYVKGVLTNREAHAARQRIIKKIAATCRTLPS